MATMRGCESTFNITMVDLMRCSRIAKLVSPHPYPNWLSPPCDLSIAPLAVPTRLAVLISPRIQLMADRTWNSIDKSIYDLDWPELSILVWEMILACIPNEFGVYDLPLGKIKRFFKFAFTDSQIVEAITYIESTQSMKLYRNGQVVWICSKWKRNKWNSTETNVVGALRDIKEKYPEVFSDFCTKYQLSTHSVPTKTLLWGGYGGTPDPEPDPEPEKENIILPASPSPKAKPKAKKPTKAQYSDQDLGLAKWFLNKVEKICETYGYKITTPRTANTIATGLAKSKLTHEQIRNLLRWMENNEYQRKSFANLAQWTRAAGWQAAWNKFVQDQEIAANSKTSKMSNEDYYSQNQHHDKPATRKPMTEDQCREIEERQSEYDAQAAKRKAVRIEESKANGGKSC